MTSNVTLSQQLTLSGLSQLDKRYLSDSVVTNIAYALAEGLSAVKAFKIAQQDIKDYKLQVQSYEDKISLMNNVSKQKDLQLDNLQEQLSIKEEQLNNAERRIAQLRLKNGLVIGVGIAVAVGASVAAIYFATK